jgi:hypothetical protein
MLRSFVFPYLLHYFLESSNTFIVSPSLSSADSSVSGRHSSREPLEEVTFTEGNMHQEKPYPQSTRTRNADSGSSESTHVEVESSGRSYLNTDIKVD